MQSSGAEPLRASSAPLQPKPDMERKPRDRRREKPLLSCNFCRSRKVRCDRQLPCNTCASRGVGASCTYKTATSTPANTTISVGDRIQQLDRLLRALIEEQDARQQQPNAVPSPAFCTIDAGQPASQPTTASPPSQPPPTLTSNDTLPRAVARGFESPLKDTGSPAPTESGTIRQHLHGTSYVGNEHWAAVLDSISELRDQYEEEAAVMVLSSPAETQEEAQNDKPGPRLLYEPVYATKADILVSIPARPAVDRMIARYFHAEGVIPEILHRGQFFLQYESFWQYPEATPILWIGLLFSVMCLSTQYQQLIEDPSDPALAAQESLFRQQTVFCLVLGKYTKGGDYALATMINYLNSEQQFTSKDDTTDLWLLQGTIVQIALSLGYHRDPSNFLTISPFAGEMRRRIWAVILQMDLRLSSQVGLPRLIKAEEHDTLEPRNLLDSDFDEQSLELPPSRSENEATPILYSLARMRIDKVNRLISDLVNTVQEHPYSKTMELDAKLREAEQSMPPLFQWRPLNQSLMVQPQVAMHRVLLQLAIQRQVIWLHRKYLRPSYTDACYQHSRTACVQAAKKILEFQQMIHDETVRDGLLYPVRWIFLSARMHVVYLLAITILCYYLQLAKKQQPDVPVVGGEDSAAIFQLLRSSYFIWPRSESMHSDAHKAVAYLGHFLGLDEQPPISAEPENWYLDATSTLFDMPPDHMLLELDWDAYKAE